MTNDQRTYSGVTDMVETAAGGLEPSEHQGRHSPDLPDAEETPSEKSIPPTGSEHVAPDVAVTSPGSGTSESGAGGTPGTSGTMMQGTWGVRPRPANENEADPKRGA